jgi:hypothetical protein
MNRHDLAKQAYLYWRSVGYTHEDAIALTANVDGETSFRLGVIGDHGHAFGFFQHQLPRIKDIQKGCGIDIRESWAANDWLACLKGAEWEMSHGPKRWRQRAALQAAITPRDKIEELVHYEASLLQDRDINRRANLYNYWAGVANVEGWEWP